MHRECITSIASAMFFDSTILSLTEYLLFAQWLQKGFRDESIAAGPVSESEIPDGCRGDFGICLHSYDVPGR